MVYLKPLAFLWDILSVQFRYNYNAIKVLKSWKLLILKKTKQKTVNLILDAFYNLSCGFVVKFEVLIKTLLSLIYGFRS